MTSFGAPILALFISANCMGQFPGGVGEPVIWLTGSSDDSGHGQSVDPGKIALSAQGNSVQTGSLNGHPLWRPEPVAVEMDGLSGHLTVFAVYSNDENASEEVVWSVERTDTTRLIMTTRRMVDLDGNLYADIAPDNYFGTLNCYSRNVEHTDVDGDLLALFSTVAKGSLPVVRMARSVAEIIVYDRVLSENERIRVETYLALRYGLQLKHLFRTIYLDSKGELIWNEDDHTGYPERVAAIGRDEQGAFLNKLSSAQVKGNPVSISVYLNSSVPSVEQQVIADNTWLIWSDDNGSLRLEPAESGIASLARQWNMDVLGASYLQTKVSLDTRQLESLVDEEQRWWLKADRGARLPELKKGTINDLGVATFDSVSWDFDGSGSDRFTFVPGGEIMPSMNIIPADCGSNGLLQIQGYGGASPYELRIEDRFSSKQYHHTLTGISEIHLAPGVYTLVLDDKLGRNWTGDIMITAQAAPGSCIPTELPVAIDGTISIDGYNSCINAGATWHWLLPGGETSQATTVKAEVPGEYYLLFELDGCTTVHRTMIKPTAGNSVFEDISLYPNPVRTGDQVNFRLLLAESRAVEMSITDAQGRMILNADAGESDLITGKLTAPVVAGSYTVTFRADEDVRPLQIIVID